MKPVKLVKLKETDATQICELANDFGVWSNLRDTMPHPYSIDDAEQFIQSVLIESTSLTFGITYDNMLCGVIGIQFGSDVYRHSAELGFWIGKEFWGNKIATEATKQMISIVFKSLPITRIHAGVFEGNYASMIVLEHNGFNQIGIGQNAVLKNGKLLNEYYFELLKDK